MKHTSRQVVGAGACDPSGRLSILGALTLVEDAVTATMGKMELDGLTVRAKYGALMVFSKNYVRYLQDINWQDRITVSCFIATKSPARLNVDVCVKNQAGEVALYARTEVCAVDCETGRIRRMDTIGAGEQVKVVRAPYELNWIPINGEGELVENVTVRTSNIDYAGHTNNVEYIRLLLNTMTLDEWRNMAPKELQVAYLNQSFLGDELSIYRQDQVPAVTDIAVTHERIYTVKKAEQPVLRCALRW